MTPEERPTQPFDRCLGRLSSKVEGNAVLEAGSGCLIVIYREQPPGGEAPLLSSEPTVL